VLYPELTYISLVTYDSVISFFSLPQDENAEPTILQVSDIQHPFVPLPFNRLMLNISTDKERLSGLIDKVYNFYTQEHYTQSRQAHTSAVGAVTKACVDLLGSDGKFFNAKLKGGRIMVFSSFISSIGVGAVHNQCKPENYNNSSEEPKMMQPEHEFFVNLGKECVTKCITVDLFFAFSPKEQSAVSSFNIATLAPVAGITGGDVILYPKFDVVFHGEKLYFQIFRNLTRVVGTEVAIKARVSAGLSVSDYIGSFMRYQTSDITMSSIDADKVVSVLIKSDDKLEAGALVHAQIAMLYTDIEGKRVIRVMNFHWTAAPNLYSYFKSADVENLAQFKIRNELSQAIKRGAKNTKEKLLNDLIEMLHVYRTQCANQTNPSQLVLPETLTMLPLYLLSIIKTPGFKLLTACRLDDKIHSIYRVVSLSMETLNYLLYPRVYSVQDIGEHSDYATVDQETQFLVKPQTIACKQNPKQNYMAQLIDNGDTLTLLIGHLVPKDFLNEVFGVDSTTELRKVETMPTFVV
jgi:protein transport protein SEC24